MFKKEQQVREGQQAMAEYQAELRAMQEILHGCGHSG
jgi:DNA anti-recombination protein RmuC